MMKQKAVIPTCKMVTAALACLTFSWATGVAGAHADGHISGQYATSKQPLYKVGKLDPKLSKLCRQGLFKQSKSLRLSIGFKGKKGQGITGIAQQGWNLYDPTRASAPKQTYHFFNQGYSNCRVYVAATPPPPRK